MKPRIEHPAASIGMQNKHALDTLTLAYSCALRLAEDGFTVLRAVIENHKPVIWIQPEQRCESLGGGEYKWNNRESTMQADIGGCRVQWTVVH